MLAGGSASIPRLQQQHSVQLLQLPLLRRILHLERLVLHQVRHVVVVLLLLPRTGDDHARPAEPAHAAPLDGLVRLGELAERGERVGPELVEDAGDELGELFYGAGAVDSGSVGLLAGVYCGRSVLVTGCV